ncbi:hypothetical protein LTR36_003505 [Oleoguttula mirabilis]|uniref:Uncharacterized protein n=1 Tax=Oleoguttula mirabilis TaxID=1507867 RepID=A0AAV9JK40_9PEZI|nr:hypothetical protein LTR36_003505 [Oleoguttula mirabilis]
MFDGPRCQKPHTVNMWVQDHAVIDQLRSWKAEEIDRPERYAVVDRIFGLIKSKEELWATIEESVKFGMSTLSEENATKSTADDQMRRRWTLIIRKLADAAQVLGRMRATTRRQIPHGNLKPHIVSSSRH